MTPRAMPNDNTPTTPAPDAPTPKPSTDPRDVLAWAITDGSFQASLNARMKGEPFVKRDLYAIIRSHLKGWQPPKTATNGRDLLLDALVTLNGETLAEVSPEAFGPATRAKKAILTVCPECTPEEIRRRFGLLRSKMPDVTHTCMSLAKNWALADAKPNGSMVRVRT